MTACAWVGDFVLVRHGWGDEAEGVTTDVYIGDGLLDLRHVTGHAFITGTIRLVMSVLPDSCGVRTVGRTGAMALKAHDRGGFQEVRVVFRPVDIVAAETFHAARVHQALDEIIALHAVFVSRSIGEMGKTRFAQLVFFELPIVFEWQSDIESNRPVIVFAFDRIFQRPTLRMALNADVVGLDVVRARRIDDVEG